MKKIKLLEQQIRHILSEAQTAGYEVDYYASVGESGSDGKRYYTFKSALSTAIKHSKDSDFMDGLEYLGVSPYGGELNFAVIFCDKSYIRRISSNWFENSTDMMTFKSACEKYIQTGKVQTGQYQGQ